MLYEVQGPERVTCRAGWVRPSTVLFTVWLCDAGEPGGPGAILHRGPTGKM